jgi:hypothetical protein
LAASTSAPAAADASFGLGFCGFGREPLRILYVPGYEAPRLAGQGRLLAIESQGEFRGVYGQAFPIGTEERYFHGDVIFGSERILGVGDGVASKVGGEDDAARLNVRLVIGWGGAGWQALSFAGRFLAGRMRHEERNREGQTHEEGAQGIGSKHFFPQVTR